MAEAAALITEHYEPEFIDINFGCPVKKVVKRNGGSGCLRDLDETADPAARRLGGAVRSHEVAGVQGGKLGRFVVGKPESGEALPTALVHDVLQLLDGAVAARDRLCRPLPCGEDDQ